MYLIKVNKESYINIDKIVKVSVYKDNNSDDMYVITSDNEVHDVDPECRPVIQSWLNVADERINEDRQVVKKSERWGNDKADPLCVKGVWSEGKEPKENRENG